MALRNVWPIAPNAPKDIPLLRFVHPLKQRAVADLIKHTKENFPSVKRLVIFGSAVTNKCHQYSDIDVIAVGCPEFYSCNSDVFDVTQVTGLDPNCKFIQQVLKEGLIVYDTESFT